MSCLSYSNHHVLLGILEKPWHKNLMEFLLCISVRYSKVTITSAYRSKKIHPGDSGIHMTVPLRAFDLRSRDFADPVSVQNDLNRIWIYDPERPWLNTVVYHNTGFGWHFHCQVHDNTIRR
jgi:hypothetical protein